MHLNNKIERILGEGEGLRPLVEEEEEVEAAEVEELGRVSFNKFPELFSLLDFALSVDLSVDPGLLIFINYIFFKVLSFSYYYYYYYFHY